MSNNSGVKTTISVAGGPEIPIDLDNIDSPENAEARAAMTELVGGAIGAKPGGHPSNSGTVAADELRLLIERVERLEEEKKALADDIRDVYGEAKARGYDAKTMRVIVRLRKKTHDRQEAEALLDTYKAALGLA